MIRAVKAYFCRSFNSLNIIICRGMEDLPIANFSFNPPKELFVETFQSLAIEYFSFVADDAADLPTNGLSKSTPE